jgi:hypothetical protein
MAKPVMVLMLFAAAASAQVSPHGNIAMDCQSCHATDSWTMRKDATFRHESVGFSLIGQHSSLNCQSCHRDLSFAPQSAGCAGCHTDVHQAELGSACARCHTSRSWVVPDMIQRHQETRFPLLGVHATTGCESCHLRMAYHQYRGTPTTCVGCHAADYQATVSPAHGPARFSVDCQNCHSPTALSWNRGFDHALTGFPLTGAHLREACLACHADNVFAGKSTDCVACHLTSFTTAANPNHVTAGFPRQCQTCHTTTAWSPVTFSHATTQFPLTGEHARVPCADCHRNGQYQGLSTACNSCHSTNFQATTNPPHVASGFPVECQTCHTTSAWSPALFNHAATQFPLTGAHVAATCVACHRNGQYQGLTTVCYDCHTADFQASTTPSHVVGNFPHECQTCHTTSVWAPSTFSHANTLFPLTGEHARVPCAECHRNGQYHGLSVACNSCHSGDFQSTTNPPHVAGGFPVECQMCHATTGWSPASFNHASTQFPLTGAHLAATCGSCHVNGQYSGLTTVCYDCHTADFQSSTNPPHVAANFPHDCRPCHSTSVWRPSTFSHATTQFPLTGAHLAATCGSCHVNGQYSGLSTVCYDCHTADFQSSTNPSHVAANFPHDCRPCHSTSVWRPSTFSHATTQFPLTGAHVAVACSGCHINGQYAGTPTGCFDCHATDFQGTTNPAHVAGAFSHDCLTCHTTAGWNPATFNHGSTAFPLTGAHVPLACQSCHVGGNYQLTYSDCYQCHQSDYARPVNPSHTSLQLSHQCGECHTTTVWTPSTMNHDTNWFRIYSGHHRNRWSSCAECHQVPGNLQSFTCISCHEHNRTDTDGHHTGVSGYQYSSPACYSCHRNA